MKKTAKIVQYRVKLIAERRVSYATHGHPFASDHCRHSAEAAAIMHALLDDSDRERVAVLYLDSQSAPMGCEIVAVGGLSSCTVDVREIFKGAIVAGASAIVLGHNHLGGNPEPSDEDRDLTRAVRAAAKVIGIPLVDHLIVCRYLSKTGLEPMHFYSFADSGRLDLE